MATRLHRGFTYLLIVGLAVLAASCNNAGNSGSTAGGGSGKKLRLAFVTNNPSDFWTIARKGTEKAAAELPNVTVEFQLPGQGTAAEQQRIVDDLVAKGIDGMAISPNDPQNQIQMLNRVASQALVVTQDSDAPASNRGSAPRDCARSPQSTSPPRSARQHSSAVATDRADRACARTARAVRRRARHSPGGARNAPARNTAPRMACHPPAPPSARR